MRVKRKKEKNKKRLKKEMALLSMRVPESKN